MGGEVLAHRLQALETKGMRQRVVGGDEPSVRSHPVPPDPRVLQDLTVGVLTLLGRRDTGPGGLGLEVQVPQLVYEQSP